MEKSTNKVKKLKTGVIPSIPIFDSAIEKAVLYCLLYAKDLQQNIYKLTLDDFYTDAARDAYKLFLKIIQKEYALDPMLIPEDARDGEVLELLSYDASPTNWEHYYRRLKELTAYRRLQNICYDATIQTEEKRSIESIKNYIVAEAMSIKEASVDTGKTELVNEALLDIIDDNSLVAVKTGFTKLDSYAHGFLKSSFNIIASYPSAGKTSFVLNLVKNICSTQDKSVLFVSLEMDYTELQAKLVSLITGISFNDIIFGELVTPQVQKVNNAMAKIAGWKLDRMGEREVTPADIEMRLKEKDVDVVFVDYLQLATPNMRGKSIRENIANLSRELKQVARRTAVPIVAVSSVNRGYSQRDDKKPRLSDLKETSQIEYDAGLVLMMHRESLFRDWDYEKDSGLSAEEFEKHTEVLIAKNRFGQDNVKIDFYFDGATSKIGEQYKLPKPRKDINGD